MWMAPTDVNFEEEDIYENSDIEEEEDKVRHKRDITTTVAGKKINKI
jgi:hypothetical protein